VVLTQLEAEDRSSPARRLIDDLPLFAATARQAASPTQDPAAEALRAAVAALNPDDLSPREALEALYALKLKAATRQT
jgi:DNA mismatch repair protein MutS